MHADLLAAADALSDQDLLVRVQALAGNERATTAELVAHLGVLDTRPSLPAPAAAAKGAPAPALSLDPASSTPAAVLTMAPAPPTPARLPRLLPLRHPRARRWRRCHPSGTGFSSLSMRRQRTSSNACRHACAARSAT